MTTFGLEQIQRDNKLKVTAIMIPVFDRVEKHCGIGENGGYQLFLLFKEKLFKSSFSQGCQKL